jgi:quercetin dioxygenase-like cupin family protein
MPETTHTPTGDYPKSQAAHYLDLDAEAAKLQAKLPGHRRQSETIAREAGVSLVIMAMEGGDVLKEHSADGVVTIHLLDGHATVTTGGQPLDLRPGQLVLMQPSVRHDLRAEEQSVVLLTITGGTPT